MGREPEDISIDDLPAIVILVQLICLVVCQVVPCKVIAQYSHLCVCVCVCVCVCAGSVTDRTRRREVAATHQNENDKTKQQADQHHRVDDRQPVNLQDKPQQETKYQAIAGLVAVRQTENEASISILVSVPDPNQSQCGLVSVSHTG